MDIVTIIGFNPWRKQNVLVCEPISLSPIILCLRGRLDSGIQFPLDLI